MNKQIAIFVLMTLALVITPRGTLARYLNVDTGRFVTMDTFEGNNEDPLSLHKYLYAQDNPVNGSDPSGQFDVGSTVATLDIGELVEGLSDVAIEGAEEEGERSIATSLLTYTLTAASAVALTSIGGDAMSQTLPPLPDQKQYQQYQSKTIGFGMDYQCVPYATSVKLNGPPWYIGYRLAPQYSVNTYAPLGNIVDRYTGHNVSDNGFHVGRYWSGLVFDNWYSGIPVLDWPLIYEVMEPPQGPQLVPLMQADIDGFGQLKLFKGQCPTSRYDPIWNSASAIDLQ